MNGITTEHVERYLKRLQPERDALMQRMERQAEKRDIPIIGPVAGRFLYTIAKIHRSKHILEAGTAIGYTALWFARATAEWGGQITTLEIDLEMAEEARRNLSEAGVLERVEIRVGDALESLSALEGPFDLVFIDHAKEQYKSFLEHALPKIRSGGIVLADNVLWHGEVAREDRDEITQTLWEFNHHLSRHPQLETVFIPLRDGISLSLKR